MCLVINTDPSKLVFNLKVRDLCKSCKRYGKSACCPPNLETVDYYIKAVKEYTYLDLIYKSFNISDFKNTSEAGRQSSLDIHTYLLQNRQEKITKGVLFATCYGAGSCKLCTECHLPCRFPEKALIPLEGIGVNVFETLKQFNIILPAIITDKFYRIGAILYD